MLHRPLLQTLREMILSGDLPPGERVLQEPLAAILGASRTPVRHALSVLAREGLVEPTANDRGFVVRKATMQDMLDAAELRGVLEGVAARQVAERGLGASTRNVLESCIEEGEALFVNDGLANDAGPRWQVMNRRFHDAIIAEANNAPVTRALKNNDQIPFAGAGTMVLDAKQADASQHRLAILIEGQRNHHAIVNCLINGEGARAEALMREHCHLAIENIGFIGSGVIPDVAAD